MRTADLITASVLFGIGWGTDGPKSGFFPFWLASIMMLACLAIAAQAVRLRSRVPFVSRAQLGPVLKVLGPAVALVAVTEVLGLYVASALYIGVYMRWIGHHRWVTIVSLGLGIPLATFVIFERWFLVPMPKGPLEAWLGL